jgi:hypothetical protein
MMLGLTLLVTLVLTGLHERTILIVEDQKTGEAKMFFPDNNHFELGYIHSVLLTPVDEFFEITEDKKLILQKTIYESFGVGLPYEQLSDTDFEIIDNKFILYLKRNFDVVNMVVSPIPKHTITINGESHYILDLFEGSDKTARSIKIYVLTKKVFEIGNYQVVL